jgi:hypothetical protein
MNAIYATNIFIQILTAKDALLYVVQHASIDFILLIIINVLYAVFDIKE